GGVQRVAAARRLGHVGAGAVAARQVPGLEQAQHRLAHRGAADREALGQVVLVRELGARAEPPRDEVVEHALADLVDQRRPPRRRPPVPWPPPRAAAASTASTWPATDGPPGSRPSKIALPIVKPHAPAASSAAICSSDATDPAAITGRSPQAATTARVSST